MTKPSAGSLDETEIRSPPPSPSPCAPRQRPYPAPPRHTQPPASEPRRGVLEHAQGTGRLDCQPLAIASTLQEPDASTEPPSVPLDSRESRLRSFRSRASGFDRRQKGECVKRAIYCSGKTQQLQGSCSNLSGGGLYSLCSVAPIGRIWYSRWYVFVGIV